MVNKDKNMNDLLTRLETSQKAVATILRKGEGFKVLMLAFKKGMIFPEHTTKLPAKITVVQGSVIYKEADVVAPLAQHQSYEIPVNVPHWVEASEDALCIVVQGGEG